MTPELSDVDRSRVGWWALTLGIAVAFAFVLYALVGTFVLGLFVYYGTRPLDRRFRRHLPKGVSAGFTLVAIALPAFVLVGSVVVVAVQELGPEGVETVAQTAGSYAGVSLGEDPVAELQTLAADTDTGTAMGVVATGTGALAFLADGLLHVVIALVVAFYLLRDDDHLRSWFENNVADEGEPLHAYATAVDRDLGTIYFGNVLLIGLVAALATVVYHGFNLLAPPSLAIPVPTALAMLTGFASLIPIVVGKVVYVPLTLYLAAIAFRADPALLVYPAALFAVCLALLDLLPMTYLLPRIAGRKTHVGLVLLAYVLGPVLFGWYGLFFGPLLLVLGVQLVRIAFTELIHGDGVTPYVTAAESIGADPEAED
ncbi:AI-2E family transporter [Halostella sp. PRR32]|uniref:AI-2E family transporter n=1 Tax=Halostella sp. PRR32 TaxID=3098147 RepID=UPI002B1DA93C|nr:AI-2E family transporter [Halostella sp. PRR32]